MSYDRETLTITDGMDVFGSDNEKVGSVAGMRGDHVVVSKGFFFPTDYFIPTGAITSASGGNLHLSVTRDEALNQGWDVEPVDTGVVTQEQPIIDPGLHLDNPVPAGGLADDQIIDESPQPFDHHAEIEHRDGSDTIRVPLTEEELSATTREVERGSVHVHKTVTSEAQSLEVPVTEEHVHVTRRTVDRDLTPGEDTLAEGTIEIPVYGEDVEVTKTPRVREVIEIAKDSTTETQQVQETVRREDVRVTDDSGTVIEDDTNTR
jgi:uncharacterized protein (TIGR02271 family)